MRKAQPPEAKFTIHCKTKTMKLLSREIIIYMWQIYALHILALLDLNTKRLSLKLTCFRSYPQMTFYHVKHGTGLASNWEPNSGGVEIRRDTRLKTGTVQGKAGRRVALPDCLSLKIPPAGPLWHELAHSTANKLWQRQPQRSPQAALVGDGPWAAWLLLPLLPTLQSCTSVCVYCIDAPTPPCGMSHWKMRVGDRARCSTITAATGDAEVR